ncbi:MAG TPA: D-alanyl-D-alanine carboxypeptidase [Epulopiscium sp.]|nr:D-alanyl-D-alanine carboxypeptidase [Candidatus Epulonipiscium sp.]
MLKYKKLLSNLFLVLIIINIIHIPIYANTPYPDIFSESAVLIDAKTGRVLFGKNENTRSYPASITKLLTALIAIENQKPTDIITMSKEAVFSIERNSSNIGLDVGEQISLDQGLHALLFASANEVANGIAELCDGSIAAFAEHSTRRAKELGAMNTNFTNPHGLHDPNHYTTAYDMALISREVIGQPYFQEIMNTHTYQIPPTNKCEEIRYLSQPHKLLNEQRYGKTYRPEVIGGKTGYTTDAGNTLVTMAKRDDVELICVVLKSNSQNLYKDTNLILDYGFENYKSIPLHQQENIITSIPMYAIKSGELLHVADGDICVEECVNLLASSSTKERMINPIISLPARLERDASVGDIVGTISYEYEGTALATSNLVIKTLNYLPSSEPAIFPKSPQDAMPLFIMPSIPWIPLGLLAGAVLIFGLLALFSKHRRHHKRQKIKKKILKFSKTIK